MKLLLLAALVGFAAASRGIVHNGIEYLPITEFYRARPAEYPLFNHLLNMGKEAELMEENRGERIVGGEDAQVGEHPYQAALFLNAAGGSFFCGGILIHQNWILTAAHCVPGINTVDIILGAYNIRNNEPTQRRYNVPSSAVTPHSGYNPNTLLNDLALINIAGGAELTQHISVVQLPNLSGPPLEVGLLHTTSGWGRPSDSASAISDTLRRVETPLISNAQCQSTYGSIVTQTHMCLSGANGRGSCNGDSGGPTVATVNGIAQTLTGCVSFGAAAGCAVGFPHGYSLVSAHAPWITANTNNQVIFPGA